MQDIIALAWVIVLTSINICLYVKGKLEPHPRFVFSSLLTLAFAGGIAIGYRDRLSLFKALGVEMEMVRDKIHQEGVMVRDEINQERDAVIAEVQQEVSQQKESIRVLMRSAKDLERKLQYTIKMAAPPTLSLFETNIEKTDSGYKAIMKFKPSKNRPLGQIALKAKVIDDLDARISVFKPTKTMMSVKQERISSDGKEAILVYAPIVIGFPEVELQVSRSTTIEISGNLLEELEVLEIK